MTKIELIKARTRESIEVKKSLIADENLCANIVAAADAVITSLSSGGTVFFAGNGGSAADAQHLAAELVSKFYLERRALAAEALSVNTSVMTAIGNDYSFDRVYARQLEARARPGDIFIGISTSGNSTNILRACEVARRIGVTIVGLTGSSGGKMKDLCDIAVCVPAADTPRIQESHILIGHVLCEIVEAELARK